VSERTKATLLVAAFLAAFFLPFEHARLRGAALEAFLLLREYAREHVLFCLVPAFFIAGGIGVFLSQGAVMRYLGAQARRVVAYGVASVSGAVLAVCSCTVLPLFAGIYRRGAGIGPATTFLYSGPAINVLAVILTAQVLGWRMGLARAVGAVVLSIGVGLSMGWIFRRDEAEAQEFDSGEEPALSGGQAVGLLLALMGVLVFGARGVWLWAGVSLVAVLVMAWRWLRNDTGLLWLDETWTYAKLILPLLFVGVLVAGFLLGRPGSEAGLIPAHWVEGVLGGNSLGANLFASVAGALMYFATLTEIPILEGLMGQGMGKGPALALLLAGPALSLPNLLVIRSVLGTKKTAVYTGLVVVASTLAGVVYGAF